MIKPVPPRSSKMWMAIRALILLGLGERRYVPCDADFYDAIDCGELPKLDGWTKVADRLGEDHLVALIKGVVLAERASREYIDEQLRQSNLQEDLIENAVSMARQTQRENLLVLQVEKRRANRNSNKSHSINQTKYWNKLHFEKRSSFWWGERGSTTPVRYLIPAYANRFGTEKAVSLT